MSAEQGVEAFFKSRWVERPPNAVEFDPTGLPVGFRSAGVAAGIKPEGLDVGVLVSDEPDTVSAARFVASALVGAPVAVTGDGELNRLRAIVANSGNANVADGQRGIDTARASQELAAELLHLEAAQVGLASTGVIGRELPRQKLLDGVRAAASTLHGNASGFSDSLLTTDRGPKRACLALELPSGRVRLAAQAKGAGMISPRFATMFCFVETDAELAPETAELLTGVCVKRSFDRISVDGQLSTSDTVFLLANGASGVRVDTESSDELAFGEALDALLRQLALLVVRDGEGAARVGRVVVTGGHAPAVDGVARAVADSPLVKTALNGGDPNWGRIVQAAGAALPGTAPLALDVSIEGVQVCSAGGFVPHDEAALARAVAREEVEYVIALPGEGHETEVFFSDLGHGYVTVNAEYTT